MKTGGSVTFWKLETLEILQSGQNDPKLNAKNQTWKVPVYVVYSTTRPKLSSVLL